jgi:hypothetical protein
MRFEHDFLISYAHIDDQSLVPGESGWVARLHRLLEIRVAQLLGETPKIWRDPKLQGNDFFADTIVERLPRIAALVSIFSPRYVQSEWCNRELKEFCRAAASSGGVRIGDKTRIFKVVKTPISLDRFPEEVQPILGYEFFVYDENGKPRELAQADALGSDRVFLAKLDDLAQDIVRLLLHMRNGDGNAPAAAMPGPSKGTVFLAETSYELREDREAIRRDLLRNGYEVLPNCTLPLVAPDLDAVVREQLSRSKLSIHLIGRNYGIVPEGAVQSAVERQQMLASEAGAAKQLTSLIWLQPGVEVQDARQRDFLQHLQMNPAVHAAAELLEMPIEDLKTVVYRKLAPAPLPVVKAPALLANDHTTVYLVCDQEDAAATQPLADCLFDRGFEVVLPIFDVDEAQARLEHEEMLKSADAIIFYYGASGELWLRRKLRELQKSAALRGDRPWLARAIYVEGPATPQKERFRTHEATLLAERQGGFDPATIEPFLRDVDHGRNSR